MPPTPNEVVLWTVGPVCCTRLTPPDSNAIVIQLTAQGVCVESRTFTDHAAAADFAIEKMRACELD